MFRKITLAAAAGAGYVLGAKAGKERYTQIEAKFREVAGMPAVQSATDSVKQTAAGVKGSASEAAQGAKASANDKIEKAGDKADQKADQKAGAKDPVPAPVPAPVIDVSGSAAKAPGVTTAPKPAAGPMTGAAASGSAPDVV